ncbi:hypothetical protein [Streptomyces sp. NRRL WC-3742]|uniref:hypothetical protein n=1 Tax=Streptomyces sp. NRRL WC-3742 TaxID=1463934 RepID=UPI0006906389|nr:hypothetical protein [Streptomyces sp. NRRL WC-3742]
MRTTPRTRRVAVLAASGAAAAALIAGCGSSGGSYSKPAPPSTPSAPASPPSAPATPSGATLQTTNDPKLGTIVTDSAGFTLYRFDQDRSQPSMSNCNGGCAVIWPAEHDTGNVTVKGIDSKLVGSVTRADGTKQVTLNGWPVYRYAPDSKPGDTKGQGVAGTWFALTPTGDKAGATTNPMPTNPMPANPTPTKPMPANPTPPPTSGY